MIVCLRCGQLLQEVAGEAVSIEIIHQAQIPSAEIEELRSALAPLERQVHVLEAEDEGPQNALEWALPVAVALVCSAPAVKFIEGFFSAAGEDAYKKVKSAIVTTFAKAKSGGLTWTRSHDVQLRPPPLSVRFLFPDGTLQFIFPDSLTEAQVGEATEKMNALLARLAESVAWYERQAQLLSVHHVQLFGPGFPVEEQSLHRMGFAHQLALGTWVFVPEAGEWVKAA
jgi:hypothetical protein